MVKKLERSRTGELGQPELIEAKFLDLGRVDELGVERHSGPEDPNSLRARFKSQSNDVYSPFFVNPTPESIAIMQKLDLYRLEGDREWAYRGIQLKTAQDYFEYFHSFTPLERSYLIYHLNAIELTYGCPAACNKFCAFSPESKVTSSVPFEFLEYLFNNFEDILNLRGFYWASDMKYYKDGDKDAVDVLILYRNTKKSLPSISISIGLDNITIQFIARLLENNIPINRLSRLGTLEAIKLEDLIEKLKVTLNRDLNPDELEMLSLAFSIGSKLQFYNGKPVENIGNVIKPDTPESEYTTNIISDVHGVIFKAGQGFYGVVNVPVTKNAVNGNFQYRILPKTNSMTVPVKDGIKHSESPSFYVRRPRFNTIKLGEDGNQFITTDKKNILDEFCIDISKYFYSCNKFFITGKIRSLIKLLKKFKDKHIAIEQNFSDSSEKDFANGYFHQQYSIFFDVLTDPENSVLLRNLLDEKDLDPYFKEYIKSVLNV